MIEQSNYFLLSQEKILTLAKQHDVVATLLPGDSPDNMIMKVSCKDQCEGILAMALTPEPRQFKAVNAAWNLAKRLKIRRLMLDRELLTV